MASFGVSGSMPMVMLVKRFTAWGWLVLISLIKRSLLLKGMSNDNHRGTRQFRLARYASSSAVY